MAKCMYNPFQMLYSVTRLRTLHLPTCLIQQRHWETRECSRGGFFGIQYDCVQSRQTGPVQQETYWSVQSDAISSPIEFASLSPEWSRAALDWSAIEMSFLEEARIVIERIAWQRASRSAGFFSWRRSRTLCIVVEICQWEEKLLQCWYGSLVPEQVDMAATPGFVESNAMKLPISFNKLQSNTLIVS
jgi:hypothetical protein